MGMREVQALDSGSVRVQPTDSRKTQQPSVQADLSAKTEGPKGDQLVLRDGQPCNKGKIPASSDRTAFDDPPPKPHGKVSRKGTFYGYWGYNRAQYTNSDIHFKGSNFDFTLHDVKAADSPGGQSFKNARDFFSTLTVPQYNYRFGYYLEDNTSISVGQDHMKYVVVNGQTTGMSGTISPEASPEYSGMNQHSSHDPDGHTPVVISPEFLEYEHCDGLNLVDVQLEKTQDILTSRNGNHALSLMGNVGAGVVVTDTEVKLFGEDRPKGFHLSGYGVSWGTGLRATVCRNFFVQGNLKAGYINLPDVKFGDDRASQSFGYLEPSVVAGINVPLNGKKPKKQGPAG